MFRLGILFLLIMISGCSSVKTKNFLDNPKAYEIIIDQSSHKSQPRWSYNPDSYIRYNKKYELFVGLSNLEQDEFTATKVAEVDAINQINKFLGIKTTSNLIIKSRKIGENSSASYNTELNEVINNFSSNYSKHSKILDKYVEKGRYYDPRGFWRNYYKVMVLYGIEKKALKK